MLIEDKKDNKTNLNFVLPTTTSMHFVRMNRDVVFLEHRVSSDEQLIADSQPARRHFLRDLKSN